MKRIALFLMATSAAIACNRVNPFLQEWDTPYGMPPFEQIRISDYIPALKAGIEQQTAEIQAIIDNPEPATFDNVLAAYDRSGDILSKVVGVLYNLSETENGPEMEKVMDEATPLLSEHDDNIFMNKAFFEKVKAVHDADQSGLTREQQMVLKKIYEAFTRSGIDLPEDKQEELREINTALATAIQRFGNNLLTENNAFKDSCGISVSAYPATMTSEPDRARREKLFKAYSTRGERGNEFDNRELCVEILRLRARKARLLGFDTFAAYELDNKMAHDPETVDAFLDKIMAAAVAKAKEEVAAMQEVMNLDVAIGLLPAGSRIEPWDWFYYAERVRKARYALDENLTRPYFKLENVRDGVFAAAERIYGIKITPEEGLPVYNPEVRTFKVTDADGSLLGIFLGDYLPRSSKRGGAWMNNFRDQWITAEGENVRPIIVNVCNFSVPEGDKPSLLTIDEVETAFHEFGHALHGFLTQCTYSTVSGTSVARDFVETFSQFNENWAFQKEILETYARHYKTGEVIPDSLVVKIKAADKFNQGFMTSELCAASILDMKLHELPLEALEGLDLAAFEQKVCKEMNLPSEIIPRYRSTYFNHIFGGSGYCAGYYGYLWSEVLACDAFAAFEERGIYNPEVARSFRETFLEKGGSEEPMVLYERFRGATPDPSSLIRARGLEL